MIKEEQTGGSALAHFSKAIVSQPGRERIAPAPFGGHVVVHATAEETGGTLGMWETFTPPGKGPHDHTHTRETETFRIIRGMYRFRCGDDEFDAHPGRSSYCLRIFRTAFETSATNPVKCSPRLRPAVLNRCFLRSEKAVRTRLRR